MSHRWQQMVMIATSSIIIVLLSYDHLQQQKKLREENKLLPVPIDIPDGFLWPDDIVRYKELVEKKDKEVDERTLLIQKAHSLDLELEPNGSLEEWKKNIQEAEQNSLILNVQSLLSKNNIQSSYVPKSLQEEPRLWNFSLLGFQAVEVENMVVMKYELTQASSWFLGHSKTPLLQECPFCAVEVSYEESLLLANRLSESMNLTPCYQGIKKSKICDGWRLPTLEEWKKARGAESQKWEYMIAPEEERKKPIPTGMYAPNVYEIHDIVGHFSEWSEEKRQLGSTLQFDVHQEEPIGVRFYRAENTGLP